MVPPKATAAKRHQFPSVLLQTTNAFATILSTSLIIFAYERALLPLYGSGPTTFLLNKTILVAIALAAVHPFKFHTSRNWLCAALSLSLAPNATYWVAVLTSRQKYPILGPAVTHATVLVPLVFILTTIAVDIDLRKTTVALISISRPPIIHRLAFGAICYAVETFLSHFWKGVSQLHNVSETQIFIGIASISYGLWILQTPMGTVTQNQPRNSTPSGVPVKAAMLVALAAVLWSMYPALSSPVLPHPLQETYTHPSGSLQIHSSVQSNTGLIVVGEALAPPEYEGGEDHQMHSVRYLRASHSILGGVWMGGKVNILDDEAPLEDLHGAQLGDSIYSTFVLQEAARLVNSTAQGKTESMKNVLVIGLGAGTSATSFMRHGLSTTIVEIDSAVYDAASTFFGLPDPGPGHLFIEDARAWAARKRESVEAGKSETLYDIVVHDCFSGGGVPEHIFTMEFWEDLKAVIKPEGVVVVNFAGVLQSDSSKMVFQTVKKNFGQCRAFHDVFGEFTDEKYGTDFINMVLFCTRSKAPLTFRKPRNSDYLGSPLRRHVLNSLPTREIKLDLISEEDDSKFILTDAHNPLGKLQDKQGLDHWAVMREVLPDIHWETY